MLYDISTLRFGFFPLEPESLRTLEIVFRAKADEEELSEFRRSVGSEMELKLSLANNRTT